MTTAKQGEEAADATRLTARGAIAFFSRVVGFLAGVAGLACVVGFYGCMTLARVVWVFDAATSFCCYAAAMGVAGALLSMLSRSRWFIGLCIVAAIVGSWLVIREYGRGAELSASVDDLKVVSANVLTRNLDVDAVGQFLEVESPDVVVLLEVNDRWANAFPELDAAYPFRVVQPADDNFGIEVRSKLPLENAELMEFSPQSTTSVRADVVLKNGQRMHLIATHPLPPAGQRNWNRRNEQLLAVAKAAADVAEPLLIVGDLNATPWSPFFQDVKRIGRLDDARLSGHGFGSSWSAHSPLIRIPIDHALCRGLNVVDYRIGPHTGSDHFPVIVTVRPTL